MADKREALQEQLAKPRSQSNIALNEKVAGLLSLAGAVVFIIAVRIGSFTSGVALALRATLHRPYDFIGRYGGEEFSVILPRTDPEGAKIVAENLRKAVATLRIPYRPGKSETATITIGVASAVASLDGEGQKLLKEADQAFYTGKELGRNRVITTVLGKSGQVDS